MCHSQARASSGHQTSAGRPETKSASSPRSAATRTVNPCWGGATSSVAPLSSTSPAAAGGAQSHGSTSILCNALHEQKTQQGPFQPVATSLLLSPGRTQGILPSPATFHSSRLCMHRPWVPGGGQAMHADAPWLPDALPSSSAPASALPSGSVSSGSASPATSCVWRWLRPSCSAHSSSCGAHETHLSISVDESNWPLVA